MLRPELGAVLGRERFLAEIQLTANLQHPHLLPLFDSGEAEGLLFYVMPYVEGESLRRRLGRERQLPAEEAVRISAAVASALDYAHRHGVVHREAGKHLAPRGPAAGGGLRDRTRRLPGGGCPNHADRLEPRHAAIHEPRAGDGRPRDRCPPADIYSLGALTYEMLTGDPPYVASTSQAVIAKLLTEMPQSVRLRRPSVSEHVDAALQKALEKLPADRFATAGEFADALTGVRAIVATRHVVGSGTAVGWRASGRRRDALLAGAAALAGIVLTTAVALTLATALWPAPPLVMRFAATLPADEILGSAFASDSDVAISADGRRIVYVARAGGQQRLYMRTLEELVARPLEGTEGARAPFFSPDSRWIGYFDAGLALRKIPAAGGPSVVVRQAAGAPRGASWGSDDRIVYATVDVTGLLVVPAAGCEPDVLTTPEAAKRELDHVLPEVLPGGRAVLFTVLTAQGPRVESLDLGTGERRVLVEGGSQARYPPWPYGI